jgi:hypothetical protein
MDRDDCRGTVLLTCLHPALLIVGQYALPSAIAAMLTSHPYIHFIYHAVLRQTVAVTGKTSDASGGSRRGQDKSCKTFV